MSRPLRAYAGGISLGWQDPGSLRQEAQTYIDAGYRVVKLRVGDTPKREIERVAAAREEVGEEIEILVDANTGSTLDDVRRVMPAYEELGVGWLEEPFPALDYRDYALGAALGSVPLAAGKNLFT